MLLTWGDRFRTNRSTPTTESPLPLGWGIGGGLLLSTLHLRANSEVLGALSRLSSEAVVLDEEHSRSVPVSELEDRREDSEVRLG